MIVLLLSSGCTSMTGAFFERGAGGEGRYIVADIEFVRADFVPLPNIRIYTQEPIGTSWNHSHRSERLLSGVQVRDRSWPTWALEQSFLNTLPASVVCCTPTMNWPRLS